MLESIIRNQTQSGLFLLRLAVSIIFFAHGYQKLFGGFGGIGLEGTVEKFTELGIYFPRFVAWFVAIVEFFGGILLFFGAFTREVACLLVIIMGGAVYLDHWGNGFFLSNGGFEYAFLLLFACLCLLLGGGGAGALDKALFPHDRWTFVKDPSKVKLLPPDD